MFLRTLALSLGFAASSVAFAGGPTANPDPMAAPTPQAPTSGPEDCKIPDFESFSADLKTQGLQGEAYNAAIQARLVEVCGTGGTAPPAPGEVQEGPGTSVPGELTAPTTGDGEVAVPTDSTDDAVAPGAGMGSKKTAKKAKKNKKNKKNK